MESVIEKPAFADKELERLVVDAVNKVFESDSKYFVDEYVKHVSKEKVAA